TIHMCMKIRSHNSPFLQFSYCISFFLQYTINHFLIPLFLFSIRFKRPWINRVEKISSTYSICDLAQFTAKPFAVLARQMCASTVDGFIVQKETIHMKTA